MVRWTRRELNNLEKEPNDLPFDDLRVAANSVALAGAQPASFAAFHTDFAALAFSTSSDNYCYFDVQMPHRWYEVDAIEFHIHWSINIAGNGNVRWVLKYAWANINDVFPTATTVGVTESLVGVSAHTHLLTQLEAKIPADGKRISSVLLMALMRDVSEDNFSGSAFLLSADAHYRSSDDGSYHEYYKLKDGYDKKKGEPKIKFRPGAW